MLLKPGDSFSIGPITFRTEYEHSGSFPKVGTATPDDDATPNPETGSGPTADLSDLTEAFQADPPAAKKPVSAKPAAKAEKKAVPTKPEKAKSDKKAVDPPKREEKPGHLSDDDALGWMSDEPAAADESPLSDLAEEDAVPMAEADEPLSPAAASTDDGDDFFGDPTSEGAHADDDGLDFDLNLNDDGEADDGSTEDTTEMLVVKRPNRDEPAKPVNIKSKKSSAPPPKEATDEELEFPVADEAAEVDFFSGDAGSPAPAEPADHDELPAEELEERPRAGHKPAKSTGSKKSDAKKGDDKKGAGWWPFGGKAAKKEKPASKSKSSHKSEPAADDEPVADSESAPHAAAPSRKQPEPVAAKKAETKKAPAKPTAKPAVAADEPDLDFVAGGESGGASNDDDDFFRDLGLE